MLDYIVCPSPSPFPLYFGFGTWIWELDLGLELGLTVMMMMMMMTIMWRDRVKAFRDGSSVIGFRESKFWLKVKCFTTNTESLQNCPRCQKH